MSIATRPLRNGCTALVVAMLVGCSSPEPEAPKTLVIYPGARQVAVERHGAIWQAKYVVDSPYPAKEVIAHFSEAMNAQGWIPLAEDFLNPGLPSSHVTGWTGFIDGTQQPARDVRQWLAQWQSTNGEVIVYALRYSYPQGSEPKLSTLQVYLSLNPRDVVEQQRKYVRRAP